MKSLYALFFFFLLVIGIANALDVSPNTFNTNLYAGESVVKYFNLTNDGSNNFIYNFTLVSNNPNITCLFDNSLNFIQLNISKDEKLQYNFTIKTNPSNAIGSGICKFDIVFDDLSLPPEPKREEKKPREIWGGEGSSIIKPINQTQLEQPKEETKEEQQPETIEEQQEQEESKINFKDYLNKYKWWIVGIVSFMIILFIIKYLITNYEIDKGDDNDKNSGSSIS